jgi:hypothetical protein
MIGKLLKSEAWKQSDPDRPGLLLHPRYSSRDSLVGIHRILVELPHLTKLESRNPIRPRRIPTELPHSSYEEGPDRPGDPPALRALPLSRQGYV